MEKNFDPKFVKHQHYNSTVGHSTKLEFNSKYVKGRKKHSRRQSELVGMAFDKGDSGVGS